MKLPIAAELRGINPDWNKKIREIERKQKRREK